jgi:aminoglycoside phosphotransferase (APT) family kinase protein
MAGTHLTLAALATAAVPALDVVSASTYSADGDGAYDASLLALRDGKHLLVRAPRTKEAANDQSADLGGLRALSTGIRARLPFNVPSYVGATPSGSRRAVVYEYVFGQKLALAELVPGAEITRAVGKAVAAIHQLPTSFIADAGLPVNSPAESLRECVQVIERASRTGLVPLALLERWRAATEDGQLWQFNPTVTNGALTADSFLVEGGTVTGVLGWQELKVSDPARDLFWVLGAGRDAADHVIDAYLATRGAADRQIRQRAVFYSELELARWLLHGTDSRDSEVVDDAVAMLTGLVDEVGTDVTSQLGAQMMPVLHVDEVEELLDRTERRR